MPDAQTPARRLELYSSAYTLSDMEIFIFPELLYSLVLANILSPRLWAWRDDPWFSGITELPPEKRIMRLKQYVMDHYTFNLDLDTWGLTTKEREIARFTPFIDPAVLKESNALFGYEGDKYYFSLDIRRHFGLDRYDSDTIPYWKTETLEAMDAFRHRPGWHTGGGECVSLSTLYAAALFVVCRIPLEDIWLLATPLHSQNYVDVSDGILTNNRRIVTRAMFFNGTELSMKARRALAHEQVTVINHCGRYLHSVYPETGIPRDEWEVFSGKLSHYLRYAFTPETFGNFLRSHPQFQPCFCYRLVRGKRDYYIGSEVALRYEERSKLKVSDASRRKLLEQIDQDEFYPEQLPGRLIVNEIEDFIRRGNLDLDSEADCARLREHFISECGSTCEILDSLRAFLHLQPKLPVYGEKTYRESERLCPDPGMDHAAFVAWLAAKRPFSRTADLAFHAFREPGDDWQPFLKAALERNPVSREALATASPDAAIEAVRALPEASIYEGNRIATPDEVWNFGRGDGFEKAVLAANLLVAGSPGEPVRVKKTGRLVEATVGGRNVSFETGKALPDFEETFTPHAGA